MSREHGGLGLGLAIAKQLAELHGGTISAASGGIDRGATFTVKLPLMIVHQPAVPDRPGKLRGIVRRLLPQLDGDWPIPMQPRHPDWCRRAPAAITRGD